jgi:hypothetical protein
MTFVDSFVTINTPFKTMELLLRLGLGLRLRLGLGLVLK